MARDLMSSVCKQFLLQFLIVFFSAYLLALVLNKNNHYAKENPEVINICFECLPNG
jgi:hypothetical protein